MLTPSRIIGTLLWGRISNPAMLRQDRHPAPRLIVAAALVLLLHVAAGLGAQHAIEQKRQNNIDRLLEDKADRRDVRWGKPPVRRGDQADDQQRQKTRGPGDVVV